MAFLLAILVDVIIAFRLCHVCAYRLCLLPTVHLVSSFCIIIIVVVVNNQHLQGFIYLYLLHQYIFLGRIKAVNNLYVVVHHRIYSRHELTITPWKTCLA